MRYPVVIHKDRKSDYVVTVPDLRGCFSAVETLEAAITNAAEAIECHLEGLLLDGEEIPQARPVEKHLKNRDFAGGTWALVSIDLSTASEQDKADQYHPAGTGAHAGG